MLRMRGYSLWITLVLLAAGAAAQTSREREAGERRTRERPTEGMPTAGLWPTDRMMELFIERLTEDEMAAAYKFDEDQLYQTQQVFKERLIPWLNENRPQIQTVMNDFIEAWWDKEVPTKELVADIANRALPLFDEFAGQLEGVAEDMRTYLTDDQQVILDSNMAGLRVGLDFTTRRLAGWAEGGFDPELDWHRSPKFGPAERARQDELGAAVAEATGESEAVGDPGATAPGGAAAAQSGEKAKSKPTGPVKDEWATYTENFIRRYELNEAQQTQAQKILRSAQQQRDDYLRRMGSKFSSAEKLAKEGKTDRDRARGEEVLKERTKTVDRQFTVLKERLDKLPTREQRLAAAKKPAPAEQAAKTPEKEAASATP